MRSQRIEKRFKVAFLFLGQSHLEALIVEIHQLAQIRSGAVVKVWGARGEARSILTTKREIKELRERAEAEESTLTRLREEASTLEVTIAAAESAIGRTSQKLSAKIPPGLGQLANLAAISVARSKLSHSTIQ